MSLDNALLFWQRVQTDQGLQKKLLPIRDCEESGRPAAVVSIAQEAGFDVTNAELEATESTLAFWNLVQRDADLRAQLEKASGSATEEAALTAIYKVAQSAGFTFPVETLSTVTGALAAAAADAGPADSSLSDEVLEGVAGGTSTLGVFPASMQAAMQGRLLSQRQDWIGPGFVATYVDKPV